MNPRFLSTFLISFALAVSGRAELKLPAILGDHMVLQQGNPAVWGKAKPGKTITVSLAGQTASGTADNQGNWKVSLSGLKAGGPYDLVVSGDGSVTLSDVLVGDVWLGSGQSNMELPMTRTNDADIQIAKADNPKIRLFTVDHASAAAPAEDLKGSWKLCTPDTVKDFSAVAYHFGKDIQKELKIPMGLVVSCWGGTSGESWVPRAALDKEPAIAPILKEWDTNPVTAKVWGPGAPYDLELSDIRLIPKGDKGEAMPIPFQSGAKGLGGSWTATINPGSTGTWTVKGKGPQGGPAAQLSGLMKGGDWITLTTSLQSGNSPADLTGYDAIEFYVKGSGPFRMKLGQASINDYNYYSTDIFTAPSEWKLMRYPILSLKQGEWGTPKPFTPQAILNLNFMVEIPYEPDIAEVLYNAMIAPLTPFAISGVLWYQGEANSGRPGPYQAVLSSLIQSWRAAWGKDLPFLIVQLPNYMAVKPQPSESSWAELRESQLKTLAVPNTAVVTTIDLGEANNIHPKNKTEVGRRLSLAALSLVYQKPRVYSGPLLDILAVKGGKMLLTFKETGKGLATSDGKAVTGFAIASADRDFHWASAKITGEKTLEVWSREVQDPVEVRYAWADNPICNLTNKEGLPASPFRYSTQPEAAATASPFFESWKSVDATGVYVDSKGSKLSFAVEKGPKPGQRAVRLTFDLKNGGYCGLWHNASYDFSKGGTLVFQAKTTLPGQVQVAFKDKWNVQYVALATVSSSEWAEVRIPLSSFHKDPYYTPENAQLGHPMDLSLVNSMNLGPQPTGSGDLWVGPVSLEEEPSPTK